VNVIDACIFSGDVVNESRVSVMDELSCSAIDISASASSCRLAGVIGSRLAWTRDSPRVTEHSDTVAERGNDVRVGWSRWFMYLMFLKAQGFTVLAQLLMSPSTDDDPDVALPCPC